MLVGKVLSIMHIVSMARILILSIDVKLISLQDIHLHKKGKLKQFTHTMYWIHRIFNTNLTSEDKLYIHLFTLVVPIPTISIGKINYKANI